MNLLNNRDEKNPRLCVKRKCWIIPPPYCMYLLYLFAKHSKKNKHIFFEILWSTQQHFDIIIFQFRNTNRWNEKKKNVLKWKKGIHKLHIGFISSHLTATRIIRYKENYLYANSVVFFPLPHIINSKYLHLIWLALNVSPFDVSSQLK